IKKMARCQRQVQPEKIARQPEMRDAPVADMTHENVKHNRMQMKVEMAVDMVEWQAGRAEPSELRSDLALELRAQLRLKKITSGSGDRVVAEISQAVNQTGNFARLQRRGSADQTYVQADSEGRVL